MPYLEKSETYAFDFLENFDFWLLWTLVADLMTWNVMLSYDMTNLSYNTNLWKDLMDFGFKNHHS